MIWVKIILPQRSSEFQLIGLPYWNSLNLRNWRQLVTYLLECISWSRDLCQIMNDAPEREAYSDSDKIVY